MSHPQNNDSAMNNHDQDELKYVQYEPDKESQYLTEIRQLISKDLSEPYSIYVYRYFLYQWGDLCYMVNALLKLQASPGQGRDLAR